MRKLAVAIMTLSFSFMSHQGLAKKKKQKQEKEGESSESGYVAYGMAGCGLGSVIITNNNIMQIFASTSNGTSGNQTFGITSGTSNCKPSGKKLALEQQVFMEANFTSLMQESAEGSGETLKAFADLLGCNSTTFASFSKTHHATLFQPKNPHQVLGRYKQMLGSQCSRTS